MHPGGSVVLKGSIRRRTEQAAPRAKWNLIGLVRPVCQPAAEAVPGASSAVPDWGWTAASPRCALCGVAMVLDDVAAGGPTGSYRCLRCLEQSDSSEHTPSDHLRRLIEAALAELDSPAC